MPFPLIPVLWSAGGVVITGIIALILAYRFKGKNIVALGPRQAGKTTFQNFIRGLNSDEPTLRTHSVEILPKAIFEFPDGEKIRISEGTDVQGGDDSDAKKHWENVYLNCEICYYIFEANKIYPVIDQKYFDVMSYEIKTIKLWIKELNEKNKVVKIFIIGSKVDLIEGFGKLSDSEKQEVKDNIYRNIVELIKILNIDLSHFFVANLLEKKDVTRVLSKSSKLL